MTRQFLATTGVLPSIVQLITQEQIKGRRWGVGRRSLATVTSGPTSPIPSLESPGRVAVQISQI